MLVISRKKGEAIVVGDGIEVTIVEIRGDKVRVGITTPGNVSVHRQEVYEAIKRHAEPPRWNDRTVEASVQRESEQREPRSVGTLPIAASPATLTIAGAAVAQLDDLRSSAELSREAALETMLHMIDRAEVSSLCELERRLRHG